MAKKAAVKREPKPKQQRLPGTENPEIQELEDKAHEYATVRDEHIGLTAQESQLKQDLLGLMRKHKRKVYTRDGIEIEVVPEGEKLKVKVKGDDD